MGRHWYVLCISHGKYVSCHYLVQEKTNPTSPCVVPIVLFLICLQFAHAQPPCMERRGVGGPGGGTVLLPCLVPTQGRLCNDRLAVAKKADLSEEGVHGMA